MEKKNKKLEKHFENIDLCREAYFPRNCKLHPK